MENTDAIHYIRKNRESKKAIIYVHDEAEMEQKLFCYFYAFDNDIDVLFVTNDIEEIIGCEECDTVLIANHPKISRGAFNYQQIVNTLEITGIEVISTVTPESTERFIEFVLTM